LVTVKLTGVILDWAGTVVDHGSCAPVAALQAIFESSGVPIGAAEARISMGLAKKAHIASILDLDRVRGKWADVHGREPEPKDVDELYTGFIPKQLEVLKDHSSLIKGTPAAVERMRGRGLKIGTTTGYNAAMLEFLLDAARKQGFGPDHSVCPDDVPSGRPDPFMCYLNAIRMQACPMWTLVKIGDTPADIAEGLNAGMWTIGVTRTGNEVGLSLHEWMMLRDDEMMGRLAGAHDVLMNAGAHYVTESVAECDEILDRIQLRLELGGRP
jgi:phosphonoacetaldehyde hydrolase